MDPSFIPGSDQQSLKVAVIDNSQTFKQDIEKYYEENVNENIKVVFTSNHLEQLYDFLNSHEVDVVLLNENNINPNEAWYAELMDKDIAKVIIITENLRFLSETELIHKNVDILYKYTPMGVYTQRILAFVPKGRRKEVFTHINPTVKEQTEKKIALYYSPKGGVGTTTIAVNTASQLSLKGKKVLLVDFAVYGHIATIFDLPQTVKGLANIISVLEQGSANKDKLKEVARNTIETVSIRGSELDILSAASPVKMSSLSLEETDAILSAIVELDYDAIVIDTSTDLSERNISLMSVATDLLFILTPDVVANWSMISSLEVIQRLNKPAQNRYLIINAYYDAIGFPISEIETLLSMEVSALIPYKFQQIQGYSNRGVILAERPLLKLNKYYKSVAHLIDPIFSKKEIAKNNGLKRGVFA